MAEGQRPEIVIPSNGNSTRNSPDFPGVFTTYNRNTVNSNDPGGFPNAKAASMLERGLKKKSVNFLGKANSGVLVIDDGPEIEVNVIQGLHMKDDKWVYTFKDSTGNEFDMPYRESWDFYIKTEPVPFVPRVIDRRQRRQMRQRKTRKQKGGFYPSIYGGVAGAKMLAPLIARQMLRMYEQVGYNKTSGETRKTRKHKSKKLSRNKRG
jgi:hypothetical protein